MTQIHEIKTEKTLKELQALVGGYIEVVYFGSNSKMAGLAMIVNEDGLRLNLPFNETASVMLSESRGFPVSIYGDVCIMDADLLK